MTIFNLAAKASPEIALSADDALIRRDVVLETVRHRRAFEALKDRIHLETFVGRSLR